MRMIRHPPPGKGCIDYTRPCIGMVPPDVGDYFARISPTGRDGIAVFKLLWAELGNTSHLLILDLESHVKT